MSEQTGEQTYDDMLPNPGMDIDKDRTALVITDPQRDFLSEDGVVWALGLKSLSALFGVFAWKTRLFLHSLGEPELFRAGLAEALLPFGRGLRRNF